MSNAKPITFDNRDYYINIACNVSYFRKVAGLTQEDLASKVDVSRAHLSAIEAPNMIKAFSLELLFKLARVLEVEPYRLLLPPNEFDSVKTTN